MIPFKDIKNEIVQELLIVLTFSTGITSLMKPFHFLFTNSEINISFIDFFLFLICIITTILTNRKKKHVILVSIKYLISIIAFTLLVFPTMTFLSFIAGIKTELSIFGYIISYLCSFIIYTLKNIFFRNIK